MVTFFPEEVEEIEIDIDKLLQLRETGIPGSREAQRELELPHVYSLKESNPEDWPPIIITLTSIGYIIVDGYHRVEAMKLKHRKAIWASVRAFKDHRDMITLAYQANFHHGLRAGQQMRASFIWWMYEAYPGVEQVEIAKQAGVSQSTVSRVIQRHLAASQPEMPRRMPLRNIETDDAQRVRMKCQRLLKDLFQLYEDLSGLPGPEQRELLYRALEGDDHDILLYQLILLEKLLE